MPRAEIPEGLYRLRPTVVYRHSPPNYGAVASMQHDPEGGYIDVCNLAACRAHWLEQLEEELLSDAVIDAVAGRHLPAGTTAHWLLVDRLKRQARDDIKTALDSIPIEGGEGS
jgi:hypothetical protein